MEPALTYYRRRAEQSLRRAERHLNEGSAFTSKAMKLEHGLSFSAEDCFPLLRLVTWAIAAMGAVGLIFCGLTPVGENFAAQYTKCAAVAVVGILASVFLRRVGGPE